jgi:Uma2 family endonuclease
MSIASAYPLSADATVADMVALLGGVPLGRIRLRPLPATEEDVLEIRDRTDRLCELIDGVLVEKTMGYLESLLAGAVLAYLREFVRPRELGIVLGADGMVRLFPGQVRIPDVSFIAREKFPEGRLPRVPILGIAPDLAVEVLSPGNTRGEMDRKLRDYLAAGVRLVWYLDPAARTAEVHLPGGGRGTLGENDTLVGEDVLPGFRLQLRDLFAEIDQIGGPQH